MISRFLPLPVRRLLRIKVISRPPVYTLIDQPGQLPALLAALDRVDEVSLDTEADNMFHYRTRVCLLQFLVGQRFRFATAARFLPVPAEEHFRHDAGRPTDQPAAHRTGFAVGG